MTRPRSYAVAPEPSGQRCRFGPMSAAAVPDPAPPTERSSALSINLTVKTMLLVAVIVGLAWAFVYIREAGMTLFLSLFFALVPEPVVRLMQRPTRFGRGACATTLILGLTALSVVFVLLLLSPLAGSFRDFVDALPGMIEDITTNSSIGSWLDTHSSAPETAQANVKEIAQGIAGAAGGVIGAIDSLLDPRGSDRWNRMSERIITAVSRTMLGNIAISIICGTIYGVSSWILGTPYPVVMGVIAGLLDLIPMIGATIAGAILVLATLTQGLTPAVIMLIIVLVYQQFENYVLQPTILGKAADVSGFFVIVSVMIFGALLGVIGAIIAVPIIASIQIVVKELTTERRARMAALREVPDGTT